MAIVSIGDMSQHFMSLRNGGAIKSDLARLGQELSTGRATDVTAKLGGDTRALTGISHSLSLIDAFSQATREASQSLGGIQSILSRIDGTRSQLADDLLLTTRHSPTPQIAEAAQNARHGFSDIVSAINHRIDGAAIADHEVMIAEIMTAVAGETDPQLITQTINNWFDDPVAGFSATGYLGNNEDVSKRIGFDRSVTTEVNASDPGIRNILRFAAIGAVAHERAGDLDPASRATLLQTAAVGFLGAAQDIAQLQSRIGYVEGAVAENTASLSAEKTSLSIALNDLQSADPFETATRLEATQRQLELHFTTTARLSRLSLADYL